jgi:hypothetical protein
MSGQGGFSLVISKLASKLTVVDKYSSTESLTEKYTSVTAVDTVVSSNTAVSVLGLEFVVRLNPTGV